VVERQEWKESEERRVGRDRGKKEKYTKRRKEKARTEHERQKGRADKLVYLSRQPVIMKM
jgi:hypothetical protein